MALFSKDHYGGWSTEFPEKVFILAVDAATGQSHPLLPENQKGYYDPVWSPDGKQIAFVYQRANDQEVWIINADGTGLRQLTHTQQAVRFLTWRRPSDSSALAPTATPTVSPTSYLPEKLIFAAAYDTGGGLGGFKGIYAINSDGSGLERYAPFKQFDVWPPSDFLWSPDRHSMMTVVDGGQYLLDRDTQTVTQIQTKFWGRGGYSWSPDNRHIVAPVEVVAWQVANLFEIDVENGQNRQITFGAYVDFMPAWSPDGEWIAFYRTQKCDGALLPYGCTPEERQPVELYLVRPNGKDLAQVENIELYIDKGDNCVQGLLIGCRSPSMGLSYYYDRPVWSPDGKRLAILTGTNASDVVVLDIATGEKAPLAASDAEERFPAWSPDGHKLAIARNAASGHELLIVSTDDGEILQQVAVDGYVSVPRWSPSGHHLSFTVMGESKLGLANWLCVMALGVDGFARLAEEHPLIYGMPEWMP